LVWLRQLKYSSNARIQNNLSISISLLRMVTWHLSYCHWKSRIIKFTGYFGPEEYNGGEKNKVILPLPQICTLQASKLPIDIFQIAGLLMSKKQIHSY